MIYIKYDGYVVKRITVLQPGFNSGGDILLPCELKLNIC